MIWQKEQDFPNFNKISESIKKKFYSSKEWKNLRNKVLDKSNGTCAVCGCNKHLVVDHIKPARYYWKERLNEENLQVLCNFCNLEKSNMVDWTLEWHKKNKEFLAEQRRDRQNSELMKRQDELLPHLCDLMSYDEFKEYNKAYKFYRMEMKHNYEESVSEYEFTRYIIYKSLVMSEFNLMNILQYVKENYKEISNEYVNSTVIDDMLKEKAQKKKEKKNIVKRITKDGQVIMYEKTKNGLVRID
jgi:hypothetical protein